MKSGGSHLFIKQFDFRNKIERNGNEIEYVTH